MEKSRAIELLKLAVPIKALTQQEYSDFVEAVNMGMDALEAQPEERTEERTGMHACDLISRQQAIDAIENSSKPYVWQGADIIRNLPTIQPERAEGEWSDGYRWQRCSLCKQTGKKSWNYCPNCGAKMKGV